MGDAKPFPPRSNRSRWVRGGNNWRFGLIFILAVVLLISANAVTTHGGGAQHLHSPQHAASLLHPPTGLYATGTSDGAVLLSWQPAIPVPVGYRVYRASGRHGPYTIVGSVNAPDIDTFTDNTDLAPGMTYAYTVTAFDRRGESVAVGPIVAIVVAPHNATRVAVLPTPLPTFVPPAAPTLTVIARLPGAASTPLPQSSVSPIAGGALLDTSTPGNTVATVAASATAMTPVPQPTIQSSSSRTIATAVSTRNP